MLGGVGVTGRHSRCIQTMAHMTDGKMSRAWHNGTLPLCFMLPFICGDDGVLLRARRFPVAKKASSSLSVGARKARKRNSIVWFRWLVPPSP